MLTLFKFATATYFLIGVILLIRSPFKASIHDALRVPETPKYKLAILRVVLSLGILLLWPIFLPGVLSEPRQRQSKAEKLDKFFGEEPGLRFSMMGGVGTVSCRTCGYSVNVVSFIHRKSLSGGASGSAGYQCQSCGKFTTSSNSTEDIASVLCDCGGSLRRDAVLFCPTCRGRDLDYKLNWIS